MIEIKGQQETISNLKKKQKAFMSAIERAVETTLLSMGKESRRQSRVDTGYMRDHIKEQPVKQKGTVVEGTLYSEAKYSIYNEFGTSRMTAKPFMLPGLVKGKEVISKNLGYEIGRQA